MTTQNITLPAQPHRTPSIAFPLVLITLGVLFLLANVGYLTGISWIELARLWPVLIILAGVDLLLRPRSFAAAAIAEIAIVIAALVYLAIGSSIAPAALSYNVNVPRGAATDLNLTVDYGAGEFTLASGGSDLVAVSSTYEDVSRTVNELGGTTSVKLSSDTVRFGFDARDRAWNVKLPNDVRTAMTLNLGAGKFDVDLSSLAVTRATINGGASDMTLRLPVPKGDVHVTISAGASNLKIYVPQNVAYRISYTGVMQSIDGPTQSANYDSAADRVTIKLSAAASSVSIR